MSQGAVFITAQEGSGSKTTLASGRSRGLSDATSDISNNSSELVTSPEDVTNKIGGAGRRKGRDRRNTISTEPIKAEEDLLLKYRDVNYNNNTNNNNIKNDNSKPKENLSNSSSGSQIESESSSTTTPVKPKSTFDGVSSLTSKRNGRRRFHRKRRNSISSPAVFVAEQLHKQPSSVDEDLDESDRQPTDPTHVQPSQSRVDKKQVEEDELILPFFASMEGPNPDQYLLPILQATNKLSPNSLLMFMLLITSAIKELGKNPANKPLFLEIVNTILNRLGKDRVLRLNFLLLTFNEEVSRYWKIELIYDENNIGNSHSHHQRNQNKHNPNRRSDRLNGVGAEGDDANKGIGSIEVSIGCDTIDLQTIQFFAKSLDQLDLQPQLELQNAFIAHPMAAFPPPEEQVIIKEKKDLGEKVISPHSEPRNADPDTIYLGSNSKRSSRGGSDIDKDKDKDKDGGKEKGKEKEKEREKEPIPSNNNNHSSDVPMSLSQSTHLKGGDSSSSNSSSSSSSSSTTDRDNDRPTPLVSMAIVEKLFTSFVRPALLSFHTLPNGSAVKRSNYKEIKPSVIYKRGDNLIQDLCCQVIFRCFNVIWRASKRLTSGVGPEEVPFIPTYQIIPTGANKGYIEILEHCVSFKDVDWDKWADKIKRGLYSSAPSNLVSASKSASKASKRKIKAERKIRRFINTAAASFIGGFVLGVQDRHWDNILVQQEDTVVHIDFAYMLGLKPPIDGPAFAIPPRLKENLMLLRYWGVFVNKCLDLFQSLRERRDEVIRFCVLTFSQAGWTAESTEEYIRSKDSLMLDFSDEKAARRIKKLLETNPGSYQNWFKQMSHKSIDPLYFKLLKMHFPLATLSQSIVKAHEKKVNKSKAQENEEDLETVRV